MGAQTADQQIWMLLSFISIAMVIGLGVVGLYDLHNKRRVRRYIINLLVEHSTERWYMMEICGATGIPLVDVHHALKKLVGQHLLGSCDGAYFALHALLKRHEPVPTTIDPARRTDPS